MLQTTAIRRVFLTNDINYTRRRELHSHKNVFKLSHGPVVEVNMDGTCTEGPIVTPHRVQVVKCKTFSLMWLVSQSETMKVAIVQFPKEENENLSFG